MSIVTKAFRALKNRPGQVYGLARGYALFLLARTLRKVLPLPGVTLGRNVRLQKNRSLMAEAPYASIVIGDHAVIYEDTQIEAYGSGKVRIGEGSMLGGGKFISRYEISVGKRFLSSWNVFIQDFDPHPTDSNLRRRQVELMISRFKPEFDGGASLVAEDLNNWDFPGDSIIIGDDVWVGANVTILKGAKIGDGSIVATGSVVRKGEYPSGSLLAGNPAQVVKSLQRA